MKSCLTLNSVVKTFRVLEFLCESKSECTLTNLAKDLQISIGTAQRITTTLLQLGYLKKNPQTKTFQLTAKWLRIGFAALNQLNLHQIALSHLKKLNEKINETVSLAVINNDEVIFIERIEATHLLTTNIRPGTKRPLHCTIGRVMLAFLDEYEKNKLLNYITLKNSNRKKIIDKNKLKLELKKVKEKGYSDNKGEVSPVLAMAVPILNNSNIAVAGINIVIPKDRLSMDKAYKKYLPLLIQTGKNISKELGMI